VVWDIRYKVVEPEGEIPIIIGEEERLTMCDVCTVILSGVSSIRNAVEGSPEELYFVTFFGDPSTTFSALRVRSLRSG